MRAPPRFTEYFVLLCALHARQAPPMHIPLRALFIQVVCSALAEKYIF
jgi:hypothetical protein